MATSLLSPGLLRVIRAQFRLDWQGIHGAPHWARVRRHGLALGNLVGADLRVVELFAVLHDSQRHNDGTDRGHGARAADYAHWLNGREFELEPAAMALLDLACRTHSGGSGHAPVTVHACWDADRLDIGRVGTMPHPRYLSTAPAREPGRIEAAWSWSRGGALHGRLPEGVTERIVLRSGR